MSDGLVIDHEWLKQLRVEILDGYRVEGAFLGGRNAVLKVMEPSGKESAIRFDRELLLFPAYIREIPRWLSTTPQYDVDRLNRKLHGLLGDPNVPRLVRDYNTVFYSIAASFREDGMSALDEVTGETEEQTTALRVMLKSPPMAHWLAEWCTDETASSRAWASDARAAIARIPDPGPTFAPETMLDNPLFVWGGAVLEDYFTRAQFPELTKVLEPQMKSVSDAHAQAFLNQMGILAQFMGQMFGRCPPRLALFLDSTGFFPISFATDADRDAPEERTGFNPAIFRLEDHDAAGDE